MPPAWQNLRRNRLELFPVLSLLVTNYRILLGLNSVPDINRVRRELNAGFYFVKKLLPQAARFSQKELLNNLNLILAANLKIRNGEPEIAVMELLVTSLAASHD